MRLADADEADEHTSIDVQVDGSSSTIEAEVERIQSLDRFTDRTITDRDALTAELVQAAARGYAVNVEERYDGVSAIAVPVLSASGHAHAAIGLQGPSIRLTPTRLDELAPLTRHAATEVASLVIRY